MLRNVSKIVLNKPSGTVAKRAKRRVGYDFIGPEDRSGLFLERLIVRETFGTSAVHIRGTVFQERVEVRDTLTARKFSLRVTTLSDKISFSELLTLATTRRRLTELSEKVELGEEIDGFRRTHFEEPVTITEESTGVVVRVTEFAEALQFLDEFVVPVLRGSALDERVNPSESITSSTVRDSLLQEVFDVDEAFGTEFVSTTEPATVVPVGANATPPVPEVNSIGANAVEGTPPPEAPFVMAMSAKGMGEPPGVTIVGGNTSN